MIPECPAEKSKEIYFEDQNNISAMHTRCNVNKSQKIRRIIAEEHYIALGRTFYLEVTSARGMIHFFLFPSGSQIRHQSPLLPEDATWYICTYIIQIFHFEFWIVKNDLRSVATQHICSGVASRAVGGGGKGAELHLSLSGPAQVVRQRRCRFFASPLPCMQGSVFSKPPVVWQVGGFFEEWTLPCHWNGQTAYSQPPRKVSCAENIKF